MRRRARGRTRRCLQAPAAPTDRQPPLASRQTSPVRTLLTKTAPVLGSSATSSTSPTAAGTSSAEPLGLTGARAAANRARSGAHRGSAPERRQVRVGRGVHREARRSHGLERGERGVQPSGPRLHAGEVVVRRRSAPVPPRAAGPGPSAPRPGRPSRAPGRTRAGPRRTRRAGPRWRHRRPRRAAPAGSGGACASHTGALTPGRGGVPESAIHARPAAGCTPGDRRTPEAGPGHRARPGRGRLGQPVVPRRRGHPGRSHRPHGRPAGRSRQAPPRRARPRGRARVHRSARPERADDPGRPSRRVEDPSGHHHRADRRARKRGPGSRRDPRRRHGLALAPQDQDRLEGPGRVLEATPRRPPGHQHRHPASPPDRCAPP